jgi:hypothetical protein
VRVFSITILTTVFAASSIVGAAPLDSGPFNSPPRFDGAPYGQQIADFTKLGGADYVFHGTVSDPDPGDVVTMRGYVEGSPFTFSYTAGNPAVFEVRAANLGPGAIGGYIVGFTAYDAPDSYSIAGVNIVILPEPASLVWLVGNGALLVRRSRRER